MMRMLSFPGNRPYHWLPVTSFALALLAAIGLVVSTLAPSHMRLALDSSHRLDVGPIIACMQVSQGDSACSRVGTDCAMSLPRKVMPHKMLSRGDAEVIAVEPSRLNEKADENCHHRSHRRCPSHEATREHRGHDDDDDDGGDANDNDEHEMTTAPPSVIPMHERLNTTTRSSMHGNATGDDGGSAENRPPSHPLEPLPSADSRPPGAVPPGSGPPGSVPTSGLPPPSPPPPMQPPYSTSLSSSHGGDVEGGGPTGQPITLDSHKSHHQRHDHRHRGRSSEDEEDEQEERDEHSTRDERDDESSGGGGGMFNASSIVSNVSAALRAPTSNTSATTMSAMMVAGGGVGGGGNTTRDVFNATVHWCRHKRGKGGEEFDATYRRVRTIVGGGYSSEEEGVDDTDHDHYHDRDADHDRDHDRRRSHKSRRFYSGVMLAEHEHDDEDRGDQLVSLTLPIGMDQCGTFNTARLMLIGSAVLAVAACVMLALHAFRELSIISTVQMSTSAFVLTMLSTLMGGLAMVLFVIVYRRTNDSTLAWGFVMHVLAWPLLLVPVVQFCWQPLPFLGSPLSSSSYMSLRDEPGTGGMGGMGGGGGGSGGSSSGGSTSRLMGSSGSGRNKAYNSMVSDL